jgi:hypothetical protein
MGLLDPYGREIMVPGYCRVQIQSWIKAKRDNVTFAPHTGNFSPSIQFFGVFDCPAGGKLLVSSDMMPAPVIWPPGVDLWLNLDGPDPIADALMYQYPKLIQTIDIRPS